MDLSLRLFLLYVLSFLAKGTEYLLPYVSTEEKCRNSSTEYIPTGSTLCCSKCKPGNHLVRACSDDSDTICKPCGEGMYMDAMNYHLNCFSCNLCPDNKNMLYSKNCTTVSNAECECRPGWVCVPQLSQHCSYCRRYTPKLCPSGMGAEGTSLRHSKCAPCPEGTFSNETSLQPCKPHTQCEPAGMVVLHPGNSTTDTICRMPPSPTVPHTAAITHYPQTQTTPHVPLPSDLTTTPSHFGVDPTWEASPNTPLTDRSLLSNEDQNITYWIILGAVATTVLLVLLTAATFKMCHRKALTKPSVKETEPGQASAAALLYSKPECHHLLDNKTDPSTSSSVSDSHSQSTGTSQDSIHTEQPVVSSPCVNVNITATFNCHLNPTTGSCSVPIAPLTQPSLVQPDLPLSQEEQLRVSCEEENSKEALQSVQESGMSVF